METIAVSDKDATLSVLLAKVRENKRAVELIDSNGNEYLLSKRRRSIAKPVAYDPEFIAKIERGMLPWRRGRALP